MSKRTPRWLSLASLLLAGACGSTGVENLQGTWAGTIVCSGDSSELSLGLLVDQTKIRGTAQIRTKGSNANFQISGSQDTVDRLVECLAPTECTTNVQCATTMDQTGRAGKSTCVMEFCTPCFEYQQQRQVLIMLRDDNPQIPDPQLELWRQADTAMEGTIKSFCPDEVHVIPKVTLKKQ